MDKEMEQFHRFLDGEMLPEEERDLLQKLQTDPGLRSAFEELVGAIDAIESCERMPVHASFTAEVMRRLPARKESPGKRISDFFFGERVLRWNVATLAAAAVALFLVVASGLIFQSQRMTSMVADKGQAAVGAKTVTLSFYAPEAKTVSLAGDFNKWSVSEGLMKKRADGTWALEIPLRPGVYHYMFVVNGNDWVTDPRADSYRDDGFGNRNAVLRVNSI